MCFVICRRCITIRIIWPNKVCVMAMYGLVWGYMPDKNGCPYKFSSFRSHKKKRRSKVEASVTNKCRYHHRRHTYKGNSNNDNNKNKSITIWAIVLRVYLFYLFVRSAGKHEQNIVHPSEWGVFRLVQKISFWVLYKL